MIQRTPEQIREDIKERYQQYVRQIRHTGEDSPEAELYQRMIDEDSVQLDRIFDEMEGE